MLGHPLALAADELGADTGHGRHRAHGPADLGTAQVVGDVGAVEDDPVADVHLQLGGQRGDGRGGRVVGGVEPVLDRSQGDDAVHRPRLQVRQVQAGRHRLGHCRLPRADRPVDGYDPHSRSRSCSKPG